MTASRIPNYHSAWAHRESNDQGRPGDRTIETGWAVIDRNERIWCDTIFGTEDTARQSAEACLMPPWRVEKARRVSWASRKPGNKSPTYAKTIFVGEDAHDMDE